MDKEYQRNRYKDQHTKTQDIYGKKKMEEICECLIGCSSYVLSPLFAAKRRSSMDPSILKSTSESEEDQVADRKVSAPIDPAGLNIPNRRHGETCSSCFDLDMKTIKASQEKAGKAMAKASSQKTDSDGEDKDISDGENSNNVSDRAENSSEEHENEDSSLDDCCNVVDQECCSHHRLRSNTVCGAITYREKYSETLIGVGSPSKQDFKPLSFTFNAQELQENNRLVPNVPLFTMAKWSLKSCRRIILKGKDILVKIRLKYPHLVKLRAFEPQKLTFQLDKSILMEAHDNSTDQNGDELPQISINDELIFTNPPPSIPVTFNNNIEKMDKNALGSATSLQTSSTLNIAHVNKLADGVQSITVKLGSLNGIQFTSDQVACGVRRASTGSAPC